MKREYEKFHNWKEVKELSINFNDKVKTIPIEIIQNIQDDITENTYFDEANSAVVIRETLCLQLIDKRINDYIEKQLSSTSDTENYTDTFFLEGGDK